MNDRALIRVGAADSILAAICCAAPLLVVGLPLAGLGAWLAGAGLVMLPRWSRPSVSSVHHRRSRGAGRETKIHKA